MHGLETHRLQLGDSTLSVPIPIFASYGFLPNNYNNENHKNLQLKTLKQNYKKQLLNFKLQDLTHELKIKGFSCWKRVQITNSKSVAVHLPTFTW